MFENIIGHKYEKKLLENIISNQTYSHAYAFEGKEGIGKQLLAKEFAKQILKADNLESSADYVLIEKKEDKKDIIVEQIRENIIDNIYERPSKGDKKVYIINDAHLLNVQAQNALLKTLEEPPEYVVIILICQRIEVLLPTIISRINKIHFEGIDKLTLENYINEKYNITLDENITEFFSGSLGLAINVIENKTNEKFKNIDTLYEKIIENNKLDSLILCQNIDFKEENITNYLEYKVYKEIESNTYIKYINVIKEIEQAKLKLKRNGNYDIVIDSMIINLCKMLGANL